MIEVKNLVKRYGDHVAVNNLSFTVEEGQIYGFLGPNGAGKSTTMNIITGYLASTEGEVLINGHNILEEPEEAKKCIGYLPELPPVYTDMTVLEYLKFVAELKKIPKDQRKKQILEVMNLVKITDMQNRLIKNLSKGYRQRVGLAQAVLGYPPIIILDEPTVGLDPKQIIEIRNLIKHLGKDHTVILSTHILPEVQAVCDRIVVINKGQIVANERTEDIINAVDGTRRLIAKIVGPEDEVIKLLRALPGIKFADALGRRDTDSISYIIESEDRVDIRKPLFTSVVRAGFIMIGLEGDQLNLEDIFIRLIEPQKAEKRKRGQQ